jgi:FeS assembly SUF system protein
LGNELDTFDEANRLEQNLIDGCQSKVWLHGEMNQGRIVFQGDSDAIIVKGIVALLLKVLSGHTPDEILESELYFIDKIGLKEQKDNSLSTEFLNFESDIVKPLKTVFDPEIPVNIYDLGLIYEVEVRAAGKVKVVMTLTSPNCPVAESLPEEVYEKVLGVDGVSEVELNLTFDPPWTKDMLSEEALLELGLL